MCFQEKHTFGYVRHKTTERFSTKTSFEFLCCCALLFTGCFFGQSSAWAQLIFGLRTNMTTMDTYHDDRVIRVMHLQCHNFYRYGNSRGLPRPQKFYELSAGMIVKFQKNHTKSWLTSQVPKVFEFWCFWMFLHCIQGIHHIPPQGATWVSGARATLGIIPRGRIAPPPLPLNTLQGIV